MNTWPWATKLPCNLSHPSWTGCPLTHQATKLGVCGPSDESGTYVIRSHMSYVKKWHIQLWSPILLHSLLSASLHLQPTSSQWTGEKRSRPGLWQYVPKWTAQHNSPCWRHFLVKGSPPSGQWTLLFTLLQEINGQICDSILTHGL